MKTIEDPERVFASECPYSLQKAFFDPNLYL